MNSSSSGNLINHWSMIRFKDLFSYMCLACAEVTSWSLIIETTGSSPFNESFLVLKDFSVSPTHSCGVVVKTLDWELVSYLFKYRNFCFWKEKSSVINLILNTKSEKHDSFSSVWILEFKTMTHGNLIECIEINEWPFLLYLYRK